MTRVAVFIDYQNVYKGARSAFRPDGDYTEGQIFPRRLGLLLTDRGRSVDPDRELAYVRICRGEPSAKHSPKGQAACQRQVRYWDSQELVHPWTRPLHYYYRGKDEYGNDDWEPREKGVDVRLAIDLALGAANDDYDVGILCSGDTDLIPAIEAAVDVGKRIEVMAWRSKTVKSPRLKLDHTNLWCHWLDEADYGRVHDPNDYTRPIAEPPSADP